MLSGDILNSEASLNNHFKLGTKEFFPGDEFTIVIRIMDKEQEIRYVPDADVVLTVIFNNLDGTELEIEDADITVFENDRSIISIDISEAQSLNLAGGSFTFVLVEDGVTKKGLVKSGLSRYLIGLPE